MNKLIRDGQVAVLVSPGYGAGWYTWHHIEELVYDPCVVAWVENKELDKNYKCDLTKRILSPRESKFGNYRFIKDIK